MIGEGHIRNWIFENLVADVMVMTTPDLDQYQLKRSVNKVHYIYARLIGKSAYHLQGWSI